MRYHRVVCYLRRFGSTARRALGRARVKKEKIISVRGYQLFEFAVSFQMVVSAETAPVLAARLVSHWEKR